MTCLGCNAKMELMKYDRDHMDNRGPKLTYECPERDEAEEPRDHDIKIYRSHVTGARR